MKPITVFLGMLLAMATAIAQAAETTEINQTTPHKVVTNAPDARVVAYYFHGTVRCETCQKIERQAREVIEQRFKTEIAAKRIVFTPVNYDLKENAHFQTDYKLPCPSLVLVRQKAGKDEKWKLLGKTWELVERRSKVQRVCPSLRGRVRVGRVRGNQRARLGGESLSA